MNIQWKPGDTMGRLIYSANTSLDGYTADRDGRFDWTAPDMHVHAYINELVRPTKTHLYGRRMYDVMDVWETIDDDAAEMRDFALTWRAAEKIVYSRTLTEPRSARTQIIKEFDPDQIRAMVAAADHDFLIGGAEIAGRALAAGVVDDIHLFVAPVTLGAGTRALPDEVHLDLELVDTCTFDSGVVHLHHRMRRQEQSVHD